VDVSRVAISKAKTLCPQCDFKVYDILNMPPIAGEKYDLVVMAEVLWYLVTDLDGVLTKIREMVDPDSGLIAIKQYFPGEQSFFKEFLDGAQSFESVLASHGFVVIGNISIKVEGGSVICLTLRL